MSCAGHEIPRTSISQNIEIILAGILNVSRATAGHVVLSRSDRTLAVVTGWIKAKLAASICFPALRTNQIAECT